MGIRVEPVGDEGMAQVLDRSLRHYLRGRVRTSVGVYSCVTTWRPGERWLPLVNVVFPRWCFRELHIHELEWWLMSVLRKMVATDREAIPAPRFSDEQFQRLYPGLAEHLSASRYGDGSTRETSTMLLFIADGAWRCCLRDRDNGVCLWSSAGSLDELLESIEAQVNDPGAIWRLDKASGAPAASRVAAPKPPGRKPKK